MLNMFIAYSFMICISGSVCDAGPKPDNYDKIVSLLNSNPDEQWFKERGQLIDFADAAFPTYAILLQASDTSVNVKCRIFSVLVSLEGDRTQFVSLAISHLKGRKPLKITCVTFLGSLKKLTETSPLVALLNDPDIVVASTASTALSRIGSGADLVSLDIFLSYSREKKINPEFTKAITQSRDLLALRLASQNK